MVYLCVGSKSESTITYMRVLIQSIKLTGSWWFLVRSWRKVTLFKAMISTKPPFKYPDGPYQSFYDGTEFLIIQ